MHAARYTSTWLEFKPRLRSQGSDGVAHRATVAAIYHRWHTMASDACNAAFSHQEPPDAVVAHTSKDPKYSAVLGVPLYWELHHVVCCAVWVANGDQNSTGVCVSAGEPGDHCSVTCKCCLLVKMPLSSRHRTHTVFGCILTDEHTDDRRLR
jgi:hypothetical protein